jgi:NAD(P)-dependent dehydrogenase (short-subunit alcohol dehydrogenase family)
MNRQSGTIAFVTGAASGIGRAIAERLHSDGARVAVADVNATDGGRVVDDLNAQGSGALSCFVHTDVTKEASVKAGVRQAVEELGPINALVNCAGVNAAFDPVTMTVDEWEEFMALDLRSAWLCAKHTIPLMRAQSGGAIVNISSVHAKATSAGTFPYAAAKAGLLGLTRSLALELVADGIRVNAVCPGWTLTPPTEEAWRQSTDPEAARLAALAAQPMNRLAAPGEIASMVSFLVSGDASFVTGAEFYADGGMTACLS